MSLKSLLVRFVPRRIYRILLAPYHFCITVISAFWYGFPARKMRVIAVTGTKGKSTVAEMLFAIFSAHEETVALSSTIHFRIGKETQANLFKMTLPGRGFIQKFLRDALTHKATTAIVEVTSESTLQFRHWFLYLDTLVFTNLQKEHIESHGSMERYFEAKYRIGKALARSPKRPRGIVARSDDPYGTRFLELPVENRLPFSLASVSGVVVEPTVSFTYKGVPFTLPHRGSFMVLNALAAIVASEANGVPLPTIAKALASLSRIPGRTELVDEGQDFSVVVDYAHTPDSLAALYDSYKGTRSICVLGNTGGGRDTWKRPLMGEIAEKYCDEIILTNEDPYDEDPDAIVSQMASGMKKAPRIIMDRREAIRTALSLARTHDAVLITGKGTDPYIMGPNDTKTPWSDAQVVKEELHKLVK